MFFLRIQFSVNTNTIFKEGWNFLKRDQKSEYILVTWLNQGHTTNFMQLSFRWNNSSFFSELDGMVIYRGPPQSACYMRKSTLKFIGSKSLGDAGFLQFF